jgi:hypothetical protein
LKKQLISKQTHKRSRSRKLVDKIKAQRIKELFTKLDDDKDGYISAQQIDILGVSNEVIDIITPFLLTIEEKSLVLNYKQFSQLLTDFSKDLNIDEKNILFGPTKSILLGSCLNPTKKGEKAYDSKLFSSSRRLVGEIMKEKQGWEGRDSRNKEGKEIKNLEICTFRPKIKNYRLALAKSCKSFYTPRMGS